MECHSQERFSTGLDSYNYNLKGKLYAFNKLKEQRYQIFIDLSGASPSEYFSKFKGEPHLSREAGKSPNE